MSVNHKIVSPKESDIGDGFIVRRSIPSQEVHDIGPFVFWDHMGPADLGGDKKMKVRAHPHIGLATITYLFSGKILHRDSLGNEQIIRPGEVNWMTAGSGIVHSERSEFKENSTLEGIQLWVGLPEDKEEVSPNFEHYKKDDLPRFEGEGYSMTLIAGKYDGKESVVKVYSDLFYIDVNMSSNKIFNIPKNYECGVYCINGSLEVDGKTLNHGELLKVDNQDNININCDSETRFMFFGGERFQNKRHKWWNFVSSSKDRIEKAKDDWKNDRFDKVINETESIPLP